MRNGLLVKKYQFFFLLTKLFSSNGTTCANSGPVHTYSLSFFSVLAYRPHVSSENGHRKRIFSKTLSWVEIFENAGFSFTRGRTKTKVFKCDDVIHHILLAWRMLRNWCHCIDIVRVDGRKRFEYATQRCFFVFFLKRRKKFQFSKISGYEWKGPEREKKFTCMKFCSRRLRCQLNTARGEERWGCFCAFGGWKTTSCYCRDQNGQAFKQVKHCWKQLSFSNIWHSVDVSLKTNIN